MTKLFLSLDEAIEQIKSILEYFEDRIEKETDTAFDKEIAKKDAEALRMAIKALSSPDDSSTDCISREAVLEIIRFEDKWLLDAKSHNADTEIAFNGMLSKVNDLPSVKPKERIGEWKQDMDGTFLCSECGSGYKDQPTLMGKPMFAFCPICGIRMKKGEEE